MDAKLLQSLIQCQLFRDLSPSDVEKLMEKANYKLLDVPTNQYCMLADKEIKYVNIVVRGHLHSYMPSRSGRRILMMQFEAGDLIAPAIPFAADPRMPVSVKAVEPSKLLRIWIDDFVRLMDESRELRMNFIELIATKVSQLTRKVNVLSLQTIREKICMYLCAEMKAQNSNIIKLDLTREELAEFFGIQRYSLTRCLSELKAEGIIRVNGRNIEILDKSKLYV